MGSSKTFLEIISIFIQNLTSSNTPYMKFKNSSMGLSILAGGLSFVGAANAVDLITNGSFEGTNGWKYFKTYNYTAAYFTGPAIPGSENPGTRYSWQHANTNTAWTKFVTPTNETDHLQYNLVYADSQTVALTNAITGPAIDSGFGRYSFSSWLASYGQPGSNPEQPYLVLRFFDDAGTVQIGSNTVFDRTGNNLAVTYADGNTSIPADVSADHNWIKYAATGTVPSGARKATVYITRSPNAGMNGTPDTYVDLVKLNVFNINDTTTLETSIPVDGQTGIEGDAIMTVGLRDIATAVNTNSIQFFFDGVSVTPTVQKAGTLTTVTYDPPGLLAPLSSHNYKIIWSDNGGPVTTKTNQAAFTVGAYLNVNLNTPLYLETFDELAEGSLPAGWTATNATDPDQFVLDLNDFRSDSFTNFNVISRSTLSNWFNVVPGGADYVGTVNVAPSQYMNGARVTSLISNNFVIAPSSDRFGTQIQTLFTGDYNLSGKTNVYLSFHNIYNQNQDSLGAVEYSVDGGATWLPALYLLDGPDILLDSTGNIDASNTLAAVHGDVPPLPGNYGAFIGLVQNQWATAAPYIAARVDDNESSSKRVEIVRLPQADNKSAVRFRIAQVGTDSWYFGIDDFGLYSLNLNNSILISAPPANTTVELGNTIQLSIGVLGVAPLSYQWRHAGTNIPGATGANLILANVQNSAAGAYDVIVSNAGGSVTSAPPAALNVINPAIFVTGQWDFNGNLTASCGNDLQYYDVSVQTNTSFGTTTGFGISDINGTPANVMKITPTSGNSGLPGANPATDPWGGFKMFHGMGPSGGGANVNQYTIIFDVLYPASVDHSWRSLLQTATTVFPNGDDAEFYINTANGVGINTVYNGNITPDVWHRIALAVDLSGPGAHPLVAKFVDGVKVAEQSSGFTGIDDRFSLSPTYALLFAEDNAYNNDAYVSSVQISNGRRADAFLTALGGPSAAKIPGCIRAAKEGGNIVIRWTGGVPLESAPDLTGPWTTVPSAASPYTVPTPGARTYYRPKIL